jgi:hypothetical protein
MQRVVALFFFSFVIGGGFGGGGTQHLKECNGQDSLLSYEKRRMLLLAGSSTGTANAFLISFTDRRH